MSLHIVAILVLAGVLLTTGCGSGSSSSTTQPETNLSGNWQYTVTPPADGSFSGGLQGGFLLQNGGTVNGAAVYSVSISSGICDSGSAPITGIVSGQSVTLTATAGAETFALTGTLSSNGSTMMGTYTYTPAQMSPCGTEQQTGQWSAISVPPLTGTITGNFHSTSPNVGLANQDFPVTGSFTQGQNIGASNATVTGSLSFLDTATNLSYYPCLTFASVNGQISGNTVILQIIGTDGSNDGQIGAAAGSSAGINPVTFDTVQGGSILHGQGPSYLVGTAACGGSPSFITGDYGNICLALGNSTACTQPITLSPATILFPNQLLGSAPSTQMITLTNNSSAAVNPLTLTFQNEGDNLFSGQSDFDGLPSFIETDACGPGGVSSGGQPFSLNPGQSCAITVSFSPQESCPWIPFGSPPSIGGAAPEWCPFPQTAQVTVISPVSTDSDDAFVVPITGTGLSDIVPSTPELDFSAEEPLNPPEASVPQMLSFTNNSQSALQILGYAPCVNPQKGSLTLPHPLLATSGVAGLQMISGPPNFPAIAVGNGGTTVSYNCDLDPQSLLSNFQISMDTCTGTVLAAQASCSLQITYAPQPDTNINSGLDYFLELNTVQCSSTVTSNCEIDSGRFPVELKTNTPSPLRMTPSAGLDFGTQPVGKSSSPLQITLLNDPTLTNPQPVTFVGKIRTQGNYSETDDCPTTLTPGSSCALTVQFKPGTTGFLPGNLTINYSPEPFGIPQFVFLRGTGQ